MIDAKDWLSMTDTARYRNEEAIWEAHPDQDDQEFHRLRLVLAETNISATKAAHLAAREAYVAAFNEAYDKEHREFYLYWSREFHAGTYGIATDGRGNYSFVRINDAGRVVEFTRHGSCNDPDHILTATAEAFDTQIFSEDESRFGPLKRGRRFTPARIGGAVMSNSPELAAEQAASDRREAAFNALVRRHINYIAVVAAIARGEPTYDDYGELADDEGYELREEALAELVAADTAWREALENYQEAELFGPFQPGTAESGSPRPKRSAASCKFVS